MLIVQQPFSWEHILTARLPPPVTEWEPPAWSIRQSLNPAFPMENGNLIPDSLHQLQDCTLGGLPWKV